MDGDISKTGYGRLWQELKPHGILEQAMAERIAVALWRQRRLVRAETAQIELRQRGGERSGSHSRRNLRTMPASELIAMSLDEEKWQGRHAALDAELAALPGREAMTIAEMLQAFPLASQVMLPGHGGRTGTVGDQFGSLADAVAPLRARIADHQADRAEHRLRHNANGVPDAPDVLARYQSALDNDLYKAMRALREAQSWRLAHLEAVAEPDPR